MNWLSIVIFLPLCAAGIIAILPKKIAPYFKYVSAAVATIQVAITLYLYFQYRLSPEGFQFVEKYDWIYLTLGSLGNLNIDYFIAVDGLSIGLLLLSSIVLLVASLSSWEINSNLKGYFILLNILNMSIMGVFCSLDFLLFYVFYELMLLPLYFLIGIWGGPNREYASIKFFLYTLFGSVFMLLIMIGLYFSVKDPVSGDHTFNMIHMMNEANYTPDTLFDVNSQYATLFGMPARLIAFAVLFIAFAIKIPIVPLHTWLPDAHVEAPTPVSIILAGVLLKIGGYGIIRICYGIFPEGGFYFGWWLGLIGVVSIIYGAFNALACSDLKRLIAYSSISHMGFVLIGIASLTVEGMNGALFQMMSHGILSSMLFFLVGMIYNRVQDREIPNYRGLAQQMPRYTLFIVIAFFASLGLPGFSAFIGELFTLTGSFNSYSVNGVLPRWMAVVAALGILLSAVYFLWTLQRMFFGIKRFKGGVEWEKQLSDIHLREVIVLLPLAFITIMWGVWPSLLFDVSNRTLTWLVESSSELGMRYVKILSQLFGV